MNRTSRSIDRLTKNEPNLMSQKKVFIWHIPVFRYTIAAERTAEMSRHPDGGPSRHRGGASGFFSKESRARARLQQVSRQVGQKHTAQTQGAKAKVRIYLYSVFYSLFFFFLFFFF